MNLDTHYGDNDTANYHVSTGGERTQWNRGRHYRNDGVDIALSGTGAPLAEIHLSAKSPL